jgi:Mrp family chromosome partitioning ATPase
MMSIKVPTLGVVQNMAYFECSKCRERHDVFGPSLNDRLRSECGIERVIDIPLRPEIASLQLPFALDPRPTWETHIDLCQ